MKIAKKGTIEREKNNRGFSLIELLVSIAILAIIIIPLLNNFVIAAKVNSKAKKIQNETVLAQSILEKIETQSIEEIVNEYNDAVGIVPLASEIYYAKKDISYIGKSYDALIVLDGSKYIQDDPSNISGEKIGYNTFKMPIISDINSDKNMVVLDSFQTDMAVTNLYSNHVMYCERERELNKDVPGYSLTESSELDIRSSLHREIKISISGDDSVIYAKVISEYSCPTIDGCGSVQYDLEDKTFTDTMEGIYLFYDPVYSDIFLIEKDPLITREVDIYVVRQTPVSLITTIAEQIKETVPTGVNIYSNVQILNSLKEIVKKEPAKPYIYDIKVQLFEAGTNFAQDTLCAEFNTTKEAR